MKRFLLAFVALAAAVPAVAAVHYHVGVFAGPMYGWGWGPYWGPYPPVVAAGPATGQVRFETPVKETRVYVDDSFAGTVGSLKQSIRLRPGSYNVELRSPDGVKYGERVYVVAGKTVHIRPSGNS